MIPIMRQVERLDAIVLRMSGEIASNTGDDEFFQRMALLRFSMNDAICTLYGFALRQESCFINDDHLYRFCRGIEVIKQRVVAHQNRWTTEAIRNDTEGYVHASIKSANDLRKWLSQIQAEFRLWTRGRLEAGC